MLLTRRGEEKAPLAVVATKMIFISYQVVDDVIRRVEGVGPFRSAYPRLDTRTNAVKSEVGVHIIIEGGNNRGGPGRSSFLAAHDSKGPRTRIDRVSFRQRVETCADATCR